jgi:hypothetical protein
VLVQAAYRASTVLGVIGLRDRRDAYFELTVTSVERALRSRRSHHHQRSAGFESGPAASVLPSTMGRWSEGRTRLDAPLP